MCATKTSLHDAYAANYDHQVSEYACHIGDVLFGLCYEAIQPGQSLLDAGIGTGLSASLFAKAGLVIYGFDFSRAMLEICRAKGFAADLKQHDIQQAPWPYPSSTFNHLVCCGVLHFVADPETAFSEAQRVLQQGGQLAFTTRIPTVLVDPAQDFDQQLTGDFEIFSHSDRYIKKLLAEHGFKQMKAQRCLVGEDSFQIWVTCKQ